MVPADAAPAPSVPGTLAPGVADSGVDAGSTAQTADAAISVTPEVKIPAVTSTSGPGPYKTQQDLASGPLGKSGLFRPLQLGESGEKHPVFVWGCGGTTTPSTYADLLSEIASHGIVVIAEVEEIGDNGAPLLAAADWIAAENTRKDSALYGKLALNKLGVGGHSIGSVNAFIAGKDSRFATSVHVAGGSLDNVNDPFAATTGQGGKALKHPVAYVCGESDIFGNVEKTQKDYDNTTVPAVFTIIAGADHTGAPRAGLPAIIAWLRFQLLGEMERKAGFLDGQGEFNTGTYKTRSKNW
ncbi:MAG: hypothetical protein RL385_1059 [Pseudomonadota bacterium]|jgi:hypothetical protein